jgi:hypothetical protein
VRAAQRRRPLGGPRPSDGRAGGRPTPCGVVPRRPAGFVTCRHPTQEGLESIPGAPCHEPVPSFVREDPEPPSRSPPAPSAWAARPSPPTPSRSASCTRCRARWRSARRR